MKETDLKGTGWRRPSETVKRRLIVNVEGLEKSGKTNFALTAPGPIGYVDIDMGSEGVMEKFKKDKDIWVSEHRVELDFSLVKDFNQEQLNKAADIAYKVWADLRRDWIAALGKGMRTLVADTGTEMWEILRMARFGKLMQVKPHHYGPVNMEFRDMIRRAEDSFANVIMLHKMKDEYKDDKRTGQVVRAGFSDMPYLVQVNLRCWKDNSDPFPDCFHATILDCRQNPEINGMELQGDQVSFANVATLVYPDTSEGDWV